MNGVAAYAETAEDTAAETAVETAAETMEGPNYALTLDQQIEQYLKAQNIILNDMPFLLVYYKNMIRVSNQKFEMPLHPLGYRFYKFAKQK